MLESCAYPEVLREIGAQSISECDMREDSAAILPGVDFLSKHPSLEGLEEHFDFVISNPPFAVALEFIQKSLTLTRKDGYVVMLLRLNFFGSQRRSDWFKKNMPESCYVHSKRIKFSGASGTDSIEYMHCVWKKGFNPDHTQLRIL